MATLLSDIRHLGKKRSTKKCPCELAENYAVLILAPAIPVRPVHYDVGGIHTNIETPRQKGFLAAEYRACEH
jgi:succinate dehydrogenase/fumarate reductase flavoprotein subunit